MDQNQNEQVGQNDHATERGLADSVRLEFTLQCSQADAQFAGPCGFYCARGIHTPEGCGAAPLRPELLWPRLFPDAVVEEMVRCGRFRCSGSSSPPTARLQAASMTPLSSRTFPGQSCSTRREAAASLKGTPTDGGLKKMGGQKPGYRLCAGRNGGRSRQAKRSPVVTNPCERFLFPPGPRDPDWWRPRSAYPPVRAWFLPTGVIFALLQNTQAACP